MEILDIDWYHYMNDLKIYWYIIDILLILNKQTKKGVNNTYSFDIPSSTKLYLKSNLTNEFFFYYKYTTQAEIEKIDFLKKSLKVLTIKCLQNKDNKLSKEEVKAILKNSKKKKKEF